jgi:hypothetical protein
VRFHFKFVAVHTDRGLHAFLSIDGDAALDDVNDLAVMRDGNCLRLIERAHQIHHVNDAARHAGCAAAVDG